jgi:hypothetical protein
MALKDLSRNLQLWLAKSPGFFLNPDPVPDTKLVFKLTKIFTKKNYSLEKFTFLTTTKTLYTS